MPIRNLTRDYTFSSESASSNSLREDSYTPSLNELEEGEEQEQREQSASNPFLGSSENSSSDNYRNGNSESSLIPADEKETLNAKNKRLSDYKGYYLKELQQNNNNNYSTDNNNTHSTSYDSSYTSHSNSNTMSKTGKNSEIQIRMTSLNDNDIKQPLPYDRYPIVNSKHIPSSGRHGTPPFNYPGVSPMADSSNTSSDLVVGELDFSPFGGYPPNSFPLRLDEKEDDDYIHNPDPEEEARLDRRHFIEDFKHMSRKSFFGFIGVLLLLLGGLAIFVVLPALTYTGAVDRPAPVVLNDTVLEFLTFYEYPQLSAIRTSLVDPDTPSDAQSIKAKDGSTWQLVFSDEFNAEGRTFYEGDDQFWTAPDLHYDATKDLEWYSPDAVITRNGTVQLRMDAFRNHNLYYRSGMLQSWNKLCFTQGALEISTNLPNYGRVTGLWPGLWTMGNLGRPGYLASTDGVWPYSYEACDAGITPNQSSPDGISYLPGQRLSACTCDGEDHPNPGTGRGAPEIDILEGEVSTVLGTGLASQSMQIAPFDIWYIPDYDFIEIYNFTTTTMNGYTGGPFQQAVSAVTTLNTEWYEFGPYAGYFQKYSIEYLNDDEDGYLRWAIGDTPVYTIYATALHPNGNIDWRRISKEPMSIIMNLGISHNWAYIDWQSIFFPVTMSIDYVRLYQPPKNISVTCDPPDYPTYDYIESHKLVYTNVNLTHWEDAGYSTPKNALTGQCKSSNFKGPIGLN